MVLASGTPGAASWWGSLCSSSLTAASASAWRPLCPRFRKCQDAGAWAWLDLLPPSWGDAGFLPLGR